MSNCAVTHRLLSITTYLQLLLHPKDGGNGYL